MQESGRRRGERGGAGLAALDEGSGLETAGMRRSGAGVDCWGEAGVDAHFLHGQLKRATNALPAHPGRNGGILSRVASHNSHYRKLIPA